jgi:histidine triad (HIT) family protein
VLFRQPSLILFSLGLVSAQASCAFCEIVAGRLPASVVYNDDLTMAFVDLRQFHPGHTLVIPKEHVSDVRGLSGDTGAALMKTLAQVTRAVAAAFPNEGLSLWHSIGEAAFQEVPHLHVHIHPRFKGDRLLEVYPRSPATADQQTRDNYAKLLRQHL